MIRAVRDLRLIPVALIASACLLALKLADLVLDSGYVLPTDDAPRQEAVSAVTRALPDQPQAAQAQLSWAQQMFNFPHRGAPISGARALPPLAPSAAERAYSDITGSVTTPGAKDDGKTGASGGDRSATASAPGGKPASPPAAPNGIVIPTDQPAVATGAERAILERLQQRREELDARARELDMRENLINSAEKRIDAKLTELKEIESRIASETQKKNDAEAGRFKDLVTMYETMKARDAAKIFDRLAPDVLLEVASKINPRQMAEILGQMSPETAERLTVELASKANEAHAAKSGGAGDLPKIVGQPITP